MFTLFRLLLIRNWKSLLTLSVVIFFATTAFLVMKLLTTNIEMSVARETKPLFGADLKFSYEWLPPESLLTTFSKYLSGYSYQIAEIREFSSTLFDTTGKPWLVKVIAYNGDYPQRGILETEVLVERDSKYRVSASDDIMNKYLSGGILSIDGRDIRITDRIIKSSDLGLGLWGDNALLILPIEMLTGSTLISSGSRLDSDLFVSFARESDAERIKASIDTDAYPEYRIRTYRERSDRSLETTEELTDYILLIIFVSSVFALIILRSAHDRLMSSLERTIRIIEMLGFTRRRQLLLFAGFYALILPLALILAYFASQWLMMLVQQLPGAEGFIFLTSVLPWTLLVVSILLFAAFFPYWWSRIDFSLKYRGYDIVTSIVLFLCFISALFLIFQESIFSLLLGGGLILSLGILLFVLSLIYRLIFRLTKTLRYKQFSLYDALRTHVRPLTPTLPITLSLTIITAVMVIFLLFSLSFRAKLVTDTSKTANIYAINILETDREEVSSYLSWNAEFYSIIRARIVQINGKSLEDHFQVERASGEFTREFNITTSPLSDALLRGKSQIARWEVSVDADFSERLRVDIWDRVTFLLSGREITLTIANIRKSVREGFRPFFYFAFDPIEFAGAPKTYMAATYTSDTEKWKKDILERSGSHVTFIDVDSVLAIVRDIGGKILSVITLFLISVSLFAFFSVVALFGRMVSIEEMKARLYPLFGMSPSSVNISLLFSRMSIFLFSFVLSICIGIIAYYFMTRSSAFLTMTLSEGALVIGMVILAYVVMALVVRPKNVKNI